MMQTLEHINKGGYGNIYKVVRNGQLMAMKSTESGDYGVRSPIEPLLLANTIPHRNLNNSKNIIFTNNSQEIYYKLQDDNLKNIQSQMKNYSEREVLNIFYECALSLYYMHSNDIIHCDIKPSNFLYTRSRGVVLTDFSLSRKTNWYLNHRCGTEYYMAPEIHENPLLSKYSDIWSLGCTYYYLISGEVLMQDYMENIKKENNLKKYRNTKDNLAIENYILSKLSKLGESIHNERHYRVYKTFVYMIQQMLRIEKSTRRSIKCILEDTIFESVSKFQFRVNRIIKAYPDSVDKDYVLSKLNSYIDIKHITQITKIFTRIRDSINYQNRDHVLSLAIKLYYSGVPGYLQRLLTSLSNKNNEAKLMEKLVNSRKNILKML